MDALYERLAARRQLVYGERLGEVPVAAQRHAHQAHVPSATAPFSGLARLRLRQQPVSAPRPLSHEPPARPPTCRRPAAQAQGAEAGVASAPVVPFTHPGAPWWGGPPVWSTVVERDRSAAPDFRPVAPEHLMHPSNPMRRNILAFARRSGVLGELPGCEESTLAETARGARARRRHLLVARSSYDLPRRVVVVAVVAVRGGGL